MTGHEIAEELRNTKYQWGQRYLARPEGAYCVLGIKALEHGATLAQVAKANELWLKGQDDGDTNKMRLTMPIWAENDRDFHISKEGVANAFDNKVNRDKQFPVEEFVEWVKSL